MVKTRGYDGVDIDWENIPNVCTRHYVYLIQELRRKLDAIGGNKLLTTAVQGSKLDTYRFEETGTHLNYILFMGYDFNWDAWKNPLGPYRWGFLSDIVKKSVRDYLRRFN